MRIIIFDIYVCIGGPYRAVFQTSIVQEPIDLLKLFILSPNKDYMTINPVYQADASKQSYYHFFGKLMGVACRHNIMLSLSLPSLIWKPLANEVIDINDLSMIDSIGTKSLLSMLDNDKSLELQHELIVHKLTSLISMSKKDSNVYKQLIHLEELLCKYSNMYENEPNDIIISEYKGLISRVYDVIIHMLLTSHEEALVSFYQGLGAILPVEVLSMFTGDELEYVFCGEADIDLQTLKKATVYEGVSENDRYVVCVYIYVN